MTVLMLEGETDVRPIRRLLVRDAIRREIRRTPIIGNRPQILTYLKRRLGDWTTTELGRELNWLIASHQIGCKRWSTLSDVHDYPRPLLATVLHSDDEVGMLESPTIQEGRRAAAEKAFFEQVFEESPELRLYHLWPLHA